MGHCFESNRAEKVSTAPFSGSVYDSSFQNTSFVKNKNLFPIEEEYYKIIKDSNVTNLIKSDKYSPYTKKIEIFFSLNDVTNPNLLHSLSLTIINNAEYGIKSYLGNLEHREGDHIDFGNSFEIDYFPERKQILLIKPIENKIVKNYELKIPVTKLIQNNQSNNYSCSIPGIGILNLTYKILDINTILEMEKYSYIFDFVINLYNLYQLSTQGICFVLNHYRDSHKKRPLYKSKKYYMDTIKIKGIKIESDFLYNDINDKISIELFQVSQFQKSICKGNFNIRKLLSNSLHNNIIDIQLVNSYGNNIGKCSINFKKVKKVSFAEKLSNNKMQINLEIAIDYTKSNGSPSNPNSNHYLDPDKLNDYEIAMKYCGEILAPYDADQLFPVYGFGGIPEILNGMPNNQVSHCFNINFERNAEIQGIQNILDVYRESLYRVILSGNTRFSNVLEKVISNINHDLKYKRSENHYYILLILTDGVVNDIKDTTDLIVEASFLPLSIVIIGIGKEDFTFMENLDGDENPLTDSRGRVRKRDIVQFIEFNKFKTNGFLNIGIDFAEEVLKEIPRQIDEYYKFCGKFY